MHWFDEHKFLSLFFWKMMVETFPPWIDPESLEWDSGSCCFFNVSILNFHWKFRAVTGKLSRHPQHFLMNFPRSPLKILCWIYDFLHVIPSVFIGWNVKCHWLSSHRRWVNDWTALSFKSDEFYHHIWVSMWHVLNSYSVEFTEINHWFDWNPTVMASFSLIIHKLIFKNTPSCTFF